MSNPGFCPGRTWPLPRRSTSICRRTPSSEASPRSRASSWSLTRRTAGPLAVMDSIALTGIRTAATAALAAQYGARRDSTRAAIIGCGAQARYQLEALRSVFALRTVRVFDIDTARAEAFAAAHSHIRLHCHARAERPRSGRRGGHLHHLYDVKVARPDRRLGSQRLLRRRRRSRQSGEARDCPRPHASCAHPG